MDKLPEELRIITIADEGDNNIKDYDIPFAKGKQEVALIHQIKTYSDFQGSTATSSLTWLLSRKNDIELASIVLSENKQDKSTKENNFVCGGTLTNIKNSATSYTGAISESDYFHIPLIMIREAKLFVKMTSEYDFAMFIYYTTLQISENKMRQLMVKYHG